MIRSLRAAVVAAAVALSAAAASPLLPARAATGPVASVSPTSVGFGNVVEGTSSAPQTVTVSDTGDAALTVSSLSMSLYQASDFTATPAQPLPATLQPGQTLDISVVFTPSGGGGRSTFLQVVDNDPSGMQQVELAGGGVQEGVSLSTTVLSFGTWTVGLYSPTQWLTVTNTDPSNDLEITGVSFDANASSWAQTSSASPSWPITLLPGASTQIGVYAQPQVAASTSADLVITDNRSGDSLVQVYASGTTEPAYLSVYPSSLSFGSVPVGSSVSQTVNISDSGSAADVALWAVRVSGSDAGDFSISTPYTIPQEGVALWPGDSLNVTVTFTPSAAGARSATLEVQGTNINDCCAVIDVGLGGTGAQPQLSATPSSVDFGSVLVGVSASQPVTVQNTGSATLTLTGWSVSGSADFAVSGPQTAPPLSLAPGASASFTVSYRPGATGAESATLSFSDNAPGSPQAVALSGTGVQPQATVTPSSLGFGSVALGTSASQPVTVQNSGTAPLTIGGWSLSGPTDFTVSSTQAAPITLSPGASATFTVTFTPTTTAAESATLAFSDNAPGSPQSVGISGTGVVSADVSVALSQSLAHVKKGNTQTYAITVHNAGPSAASGVVLSDAIPSGTVFASLNGGGASCTAPAKGGTGTVKCTVGGMAAGATVTITLSVTVKSNVSITDTASVSASSPDPVAANNTASITATYP